MLTEENDVSAQKTAFESAAREILPSADLVTIERISGAFEEWARAWQMQYAMQREQLRHGQSDCELSRVALQYAHAAMVRELRRGEALAAQLRRAVMVQETILSLVSEAPPELRKRVQDAFKRPPSPVEPPLRTVGPIIDQRYRSGTFADEAGNMSTYPFVGWSLVTDLPPGRDDVMQATFRAGGRAYTVGDMERLLHLTLRSLD